MKYRPKYPFEGFCSLEEARKWVRKFVDWHNNTHLHSGINFITPYQRHYGLSQKVMDMRIATYEEARNRHPERWPRNIRDWTLPEYVALNPVKEEELKDFEQQKK